MVFVFVRQLGGGEGSTVFWFVFVRHLGGGEESTVFWFVFVRQLGGGEGSTVFCCYGYVSMETSGLPSAKMPLLW